MKRSIVGLIFLGVAVSFTAPVSAEGGIGGRPAAPNPEVPRSQSIFIHTLKPSEMVSDQLYVNNGSDRERTISLYAVDGEVTNTGAYSCKQRAERVSDSGKWIKLAADEVTLGPGEHQIVNFSITAPQKTDVGEHNACIILEDKHDEGVQGAAGVRLFTRQAVRVITTIPGDLKREVALTAFNVTGTNSQQVYDLAISNTGNVSTDVQTVIKMKDTFGREVYQNGGSSPVLADTTLRQQYTDKKTLFWGGWYTAQATLTYDGRADKYGLASDAQVKELQSAPITIFIMPTTQAILIMVFGLLVLIGGSVWATYRVRQARRPKVRLR